MRTKAIGIDPDSTGAICALVDAALPKVVVKEFPISSDALSQLVQWGKRQTDTVIALEGRNGQSKPIERALRTAGVVFYSFTAHEVSKFRSAVLGQNKNNEKDAEAVASVSSAPTALHTVPWQSITSGNRRSCGLPEERAACPFIPRGDNLPEKAHYVRLRATRPWK